jgi:ABC-type dipeptide/oligopeptide/nickel transport system permease subunit
MSFKLFGTEPALIVGAISAALSLVVTLGVGLSADQAGAWTAVISGVFAVVTAVLTRPIAPAAFTGLVAVVADLLAAYHFNVSAGTVAAVNTVVIAVLALVTRGQVSPTMTKPPAPPSASSPTQVV